MNGSQNESFNELEAHMRKNHPMLIRALEQLSEHYHGVFIMVHCFDAVSQFSSRDVVTRGDPHAIRHILQTEMNEQQFRDLVGLHMKYGLIKQQQPPPSEPPNENQNAG